MCIRHFCKEDLMQVSKYFDEKTGRQVEANLSRPRLKEHAVPKIFHNHPIGNRSCKSTDRVAPEKKKEMRENTHMRNALKLSLKTHQEFIDSKKVTSLRDIERGLHEMNRDFWNYVECSDNNITISNIIQGKPPRFAWSIIIEFDLSLTIYMQETKITKLNDKSISKIVTNIDGFMELLKQIESFDWNVNHSKGTSKLELAVYMLESCVQYNDSEILKFICEQLSLFMTNSPRYSSDLLVFSALLHNISPSAYSFLRNFGVVILPSITTIRRINHTMDQDATFESRNSFLAYIKSKVPSLKPEDKTVTLMMDEIHLKSCYDYKGGNIVGSAYNSIEPATTAYVFMCSSIKSSFKDVVCILPVKRVKAENLNEFILKIVNGLYELGIFVMCIVSDNNAINRKAISLLSNPPKLSIVYKHPADDTKPLFFVLDAVHILKCIRNNWLNQKNQDICMKYPSFHQHSSNFHTASFEALRQLCRIEQDSILQYSKFISVKALYPSNIERQNVSLALQIFNDHVVEALRSFGVSTNISNAMHTSQYIEIILNWWKICNVKTPWKTVRLRDPYSGPLALSDDNLCAKYLYDFLDWLNTWNSNEDPIGKLSKETALAIRHTTYALIEITRYCTTELSMHYILTGKFQTDPLEARFGLYRRLSGTTYNISARQLFESENKIRARSLLKLQLPFNHGGIVNIENMHTESDIPINNFSDDVRINCIKVLPEDIEKANSVLPVITYVAGYCGFSILKKYNCSMCKEMLSRSDTPSLNISDNFSMINGLDRGGLLYPNEIPINIVLYSYIVINKLTVEEVFLTSNNHRELAFEAILESLINNEVQFDTAFCENNHCSNRLLKLIVWKSCNVLLNNFCKLMNSKVSRKSKNSSSRKLSTLSC